MTTGRNRVEWDAVAQLSGDEGRGVLTVGTER